MQSSTLPSFDEPSKAELVEKLKAEQEKNEAYFRLIADMLHEFRNPVVVIRSYAQLLLASPAEELPPLTETQAKYAQTINLTGERLQKTQNFFFLALRTIQLLHVPPPKEKVVLAEIEGLQNQTTSDLHLLSPIDASKQAISTIMDLLNFMNSDELEVSLEEDENWIRFKFSNFMNPPFWLKRSLNEKTNRLSCDESMPGYDPLCLVIGLVEKQSGAAYIKLGNDSTYSFSFTLPVYREDD